MLKAIWVCAVVKGMAFKQFNLVEGIEIREC